MIRSATLAALWVVLFAVPALAGPCRNMTFDDTSYAICEVHAGDDLRLFQADAHGAPLGSFPAVDEKLRAEGKALAFGMNGGMYHPNRAPVGLLIEDGQQRAPIVTAAGPGNFGMLPNGVFCVKDRGFAIIESRAFAAKPPTCRFATQSGPMLVIDGALHPRFIENSDSRYIRNGVGVSADGKTALFAISGKAVNFIDFARLFRDGLHVPNALYFDGKISRLYAPDLGRNDFGFSMGPIIGLATPKP